MRLEGKSALVTGAASGFGREIAIRFAEEGANVALADINESGASKAAMQIGGSAIALACDVSDASGVQSAVETSIDAFGSLDIVVNNAGCSHRNQPLLDVDEAQLRKIYEVNVFSIYFMTQAIIPHWRKAGKGVMLNVGSTAGIRPRPGLTWYNSTKGAVHLMTKSLAVELAPDNVRVCGLAPVLGRTAMLETFLGMPATGENMEKFLATIPLGRLSEPRDIANAALFLASDDAEFITGVILEVDGGRCV